MGKVEPAGEFGQRSDGMHLVGRAGQHRKRRDRERFDAFVAQRADRQGACPLGKPRARGVEQQIVMRESRHAVRPAERLEKLDLDGCVGDVILATDTCR